MTRSRKRREEDLTDNHEGEILSAEGEEIDVPEISSFLKDYRALCRKHRMMVEQDLDPDGRSYLTLGPWDDHGDLELDLDEAHDLPCVTQACKEIERRRKETAAAEKRRFQQAVLSAKPGDPIELLKEALPHLDRLQGLEDLQVKIEATVRNKARN